MKKSFKISIVVVLLIFLWWVWSYFNPRPSSELGCYLNDKICMDIFYYNGEGDFDDSESSLYFANHKLSKEQQYNFRNQHLIYYPKLFDYLNSCIELNDSTLICSYQSVITFKGKSCKSVIQQMKGSDSLGWEQDDLLERVPLNQWEISFFKLRILNFETYSYQVSELKDIDFIKMDRSILKWKKQQNINDRQWVRCDASD